MIKSSAISILALVVCITVSGQTLNCKIVDTNQDKCYNAINQITPPAPGQAFYGQDAQNDGFQPSYQDNDDGTVTDLVTGLMWQQQLFDSKLTYIDAVASADTFSLAGYDDWRLPTIKELYSLILFSGADPSGPNPVNLVPFIDTNYFEFRYGDTLSGERIIDAQYASSTEYVGTTMGGDFTIFGVNFADGRIKGYGTGPLPGQTGDKTFEVRYVRGNTQYGGNEFIDAGDGTIQDAATSLIWDKNDSGDGLNWEEALAWVEQKNAELYRGYNDWRLPNAKEMQSILDYTRSPQTTNSASIDPIFNISSIIDEGGGTNYPFFWTGTTHVSSNGMGEFGVYLCFGEALGWMEMPPGSGNYTLMDVHGAGAQRSDPKSGDPANWPHGNGPQGDVVRIYNYVRLVRSDSSVGINETSINDIGLNIFPNPSQGSVTIQYTLTKTNPVTIDCLNLIGQKVATITGGPQLIGTHSSTWESGLPGGIYLIRVTVGQDVNVSKLVIQ